MHTPLRTPLRSILHKLGRAETNGLLSADEKAEVDAMSWEALMEGHTMVGGA